MVISDMNERECGIIIFFTEDRGHNFFFISITVISI